MPGQLSGQPSKVKKPKPKKPPQDASDRQKPKVKKPKSPASTLDALDRLRGDVPRGTPTPTYTTKPTGTKKFKALQLAYARNLGHRLVAQEISKKDFDRSLKRMGIKVEDLATGGLQGAIEKTAANLGFGETAKLLPGGETAEGISPWMLGFEAGSVLPIGRGLRLGVKGAKLAGVGRLVSKTPDRTIKVGGKVVQLQGARSRITRYGIEKPIDAASLWLMREESKAARAVSKVLRTAPAQARAAKALGRERAAEQATIQSMMVSAEKNLLKEGTVEDLAHFWWAQVPKKHRNVDTLVRVRQKRTDELADLLDGTVLEKIQARQAATRAEIARLQSEGAEFKIIAPLIKDLDELKFLADDISPRIDDVAESIAKLDQAIAKPPKLKAKTIAAVHSFSGDRRDVLEGVEVLDPERATVREGLVSRWLGYEPTGEEAFVGHRMGKPRGANPSLMATSVGTGKVRLPEGVATENKLVLAKGGRLRETTQIAAQDWQAAQVYRDAQVTRDIFGEVGSEFTGRLPAKHLLVNRKGKVLPPGLKRDRIPDLINGSEEEIRAAADEILRGFIAQTPEQVDEMVAAARAAGHTFEDLRVIPESFVRRYFAQFTPAKRAGDQATRLAGTAYDSAVDFTAASIVFARLGYIPKNIAQNLVMSIPHQGPFALVNIPRAAQVLADPDLRHLAAGQVGFSAATAGIGQEMAGFAKARGLPHKAAEFVGKFADNPLRISAFLHEAAAEGVISKFNPVLTKADKEALIDLITNPENRVLLGKIRHRGVEAMGDFSRLTPTQRRWARRFLIIPGWLWAGSRYPVHFAATHPVRSAAIGYAAAGEPGADRLGLPQNAPITEWGAEGLPYYLEGIETPWGVERTTSLSPIGTPLELGGAALGTGDRTLGSYANPLLTQAWNVLNQQASGPYGAYPVDTRQEALKRAGERLVPNYPFIQDLISPSEDPRYPGDRTRLGRLRREAGIFPIEITRDEPTGAKATAKKELTELQQGVKNLPPKYRKVAARDLTRAYAKKTQIDVLRADIEKDTESGEPYYQAVYPAELDLGVKWGLITPAIASKQKKWAETATAEELEDETRYYRDHILAPEYLEIISDVRGAVEYYAPKSAK